MTRAAIASVFGVNPDDLTVEMCCTFIILLCTYFTKDKMLSSGMCMDIKRVINNGDYR